MIGGFQVGAFQPAYQQQESRKQGAGSNKKRRKRYQEKYLVEIDGVDFVVQSAEEAEALLAEARQTVEEAVAVPQAVQKIKAPKIRVRGPVTPDLSELVSIVKDAREAIRAIYEQARNAEIATLLRMKAEDDDEDDALTVLLH